MNNLFKYSYFAYKNGLIPRLCDEIIRYSFSFEKTIGKTFGNQKPPKKSKRNSFVTWIKPFWIYKEILPFIKDSNKAAGWNFNIVYPESFQFTEYDGDKKQHYTWHNDSSKEQLNDSSHNGTYRKLSTTILLNDPNEYEGGDLEFYDYGPPKKGKKLLLETKHLKQKGTIINFPSFIYHRVTPVTKGKRYSLVMWHRGPKFT